MIVKTDGSFAALGRMVAGGPNISIIVHHAELGYPGGRHTAGGTQQPNTSPLSSPVLTVVNIHVVAWIHHSLSTTVLST